ncbi:MAG TPA: hypothetical protein DCP92_06875 [Nitrospiraceae bacterium]|nr:hypothetical protein [Nitrospiraceae bacterium]
MKRYPLSLYVICVIIVLVLINYIAWFVGGEARLKSVEIFSVGFLLGMLAMYIAVHVYRWK